MRLMLILCFSVALILIPYIYGDEWDRWSFGEGNVAHMKQNTGFWKSEKEKTEFIIVYALWHLLLVGIIVGTIYG